MNRVIEADFFPRRSNLDFSASNSYPTFGIPEKRRILVVDNDRNITHLIKVLLERTGRFIVFEENNSIKAHQSAWSFRPHLILLDVVMPGSDGAEIAAQIGADPALQQTPVIFLTALVTSAEAKTGLRIDGHPFLAKPINIQDLISAIEKLLSAPTPV